MSVINVDHLTFYYEGSSDNIFEDATFRIDTDWKLGFIARNGRGKTTFLKLLLGEYEYRGTISSAMEFEYFPYRTENPSMETIALMEQWKPDYEFWKVCRELTLMEVDTEICFRPFSTLSNGEQTKVMLAVLFSDESKFLLIDEPTNHLDMEGRETVSRYLNTKKGFILVSHDRIFLDQCVDHVLSINKETIEVQQGNFSSWQENKRRQDEFEKAENERLKKDIKRLQASARTAHEWADKVEATKIGHRGEEFEKSLDLRAYIGEKSRRMQMRRKNLERRQNRAIDEKSGLLKNIETVEDLKLFPKQHYKQVLLRMEDISLYYQRNNQEEELKKVTEHFQMEIRNGDRIVLQGRNGCGKSSLLKAILLQAGFQSEDLVPVSKNLITEGSIEMAAGLKISYVSQETSYLKGTLSDYAGKYGIDETIFLTLLRKLDFSREQFSKKMEEFSGGQKKKVLIARSLCEQAHLYIWDEPLNFIDVFSRMQIEELILKYNPTLLMVEHDKAFSEKVGAKAFKAKN